MTRPLTDLEGRLDAALRRADKISQSSPHTPPPGLSDSKRAAAPVRVPAATIYHGHALREQTPAARATREAERCPDCEEQCAEIFRCKSCGERGCEQCCAAHDCEALLVCGACGAEIDGAHDCGGAR